MPLPDQRTLLLVMLLSTFAQAVVMHMVNRVQGQYPGPRMWARASVLIFLGNLLFLLRGAIDDFLSVLVANTIVLAGFALISHGVHLFLGRPSPRRFFWLMCGAALLLMAIFNYLIPYLAARVIIYCLCMGPLMLQMAWTLHRTAQDRQAQTYGFMALAYLLYGGFMVARAIYTLATGEVPPILEPNLMFSANLLVHILSTITLTVGLPLLMSSRLAADLEAHVADLRDEIGLRKQAEERLAREAALDPLTGLHNRRKFFAEAAKSVSLARRHGLPLSLIIFDLDHFKEVNDAHGHEVGDEALKALAGFCQSKVRVEDTLARVGGEEFVILLPDTDLEAALVLAERLRLGLSRLAVGPPARPVRLTASFGVSQLGPADAGVEPLLKRADLALYAAKQAGRDQVRAQPED